MSFTRVRDGTHVSSTATNVAVTFAAAPAQGNLLVAMVESASAQAVAAGWNALTAITNGDVSCMYWKLCGAGESTSQICCTVTSNTSRVAVIAEYSTPNGWNSTQPEVSTQNADNNAAKVITGACNPADGVERLVIGGIGSDGARTYTTQQVNGSAVGVTDVNTGARGTTAGGESVDMFEAFVASTVSGNYTAGATASAADTGGMHIGIFQPVTPAATKAPPIVSKPWRIWNRRGMAA